MVQARNKQGSDKGQGRAEVTGMEPSGVMLTAHSVDLGSEQGQGLELAFAQ